MEQIKRVNRIWTTDSLFLRDSLDIPVPKDTPKLYSMDSNGSESVGLDSPPMLSPNSTTDYTMSTGTADSPSTFSDLLSPDSNAHTIVDKSEQSVADILIRIDSSIAQTRSKVAKM